MAEGKEEQNEKKGIFDLKLVIVAVAIIILTAGIAYTVAKIVVNPAVEDSSAGIVPKSLGPLYELDDFTVNLADSNGRRFIQTKMILAISNNNVRKELDEKKPLIRDRIIITLGEKTIGDIESVNGKVMLKQEIINNLNPLLVTGEIEELYFDSFVFQ